MDAIAAPVDRPPATPPSALPAAITSALRLHQWLKNLLIFLPPLAAHRFDGETLSDAGLAFAALSLCASGGYILNDLRDIASDRRHARKRDRPFASGRLSPTIGVCLIAATWGLGLAIAAWLLPPAFAALALTYIVGTVAYSALLKHIAVLDVIVLAGLYVLRVVAGGTATAIPVSSWLLAFTLFVSLSLAFLKRFIEVRSLAGAVPAYVPGRGYRSDDAGWLHSVGLTSAFLGVLVLALYASSPDVSRLYSQPDRLLLICPVVLFWATRTWFLAHRGELHDDPVVAVARDPVAYLVVAVAGGLVLLSM